ncbi:MAG: discoidin domain-containing protein [Armatimonadetes bacterium]|nr:discoidin domain-containing protein [Armatimonadota bacterium]
MPQAIRCVLLTLLTTAAIGAAEPRWVLDRPENVALELDGTALPLRVTSRAAGAIVQTVDLPGGGQLTVRRQLRDGVETWRIEPERPVTGRLEVRRTALLSSPARSVTLFRRDGWARPEPLAGTVRAEYRFAGLPPSEAQPLALPTVLLRGDGDCTVGSDPRLGTRFECDGQQVVVSWSYLGDRVPLAAPETRTLVWRSGPTAAGDGVVPALDRWFADALPDVPRGPAWLHDIAMVSYDYLSGVDNANGWERDVRALAAMLPVAQRKRVALCFHGWYDCLGRYTYDQAADRLDAKWTAMARTRKVALSREEMRHRLKLARDLGFRVLIYFADGLLQDSGAAGYHADWDLVDPAGGRITGWQGPDTWSTTYARNPANPAVAAWYQGYLRALLKAYGDVTDGFVWDETFYVRAGAVAARPRPAYADRAMLDLVASLTRIVSSANTRLAFLSSDCQGIGQDIPGYAMVAHGTYQDTACSPAAWSYGLLPNWRNTLWSCNWWPFGRLRDTRYGVRNYGTPVAISAGWEDDRGPSRWSEADRRAILGLLAERLARAPVRYLARDPAGIGTLPVSPNDAIPTPAADEVNWAATSRGAQGTASSCDTYGGLAWSADWALDGVRDDTGWCRNHGWASGAGQALPQWLAVRFEQPRTLRRFVVITYDRPGTSESCGKWGILTYDLQVPDGDGWRSVVVQAKDQAQGVHVHTLAEPLTTSAFRLLVRSVAADDGQARLLQLEAWGPR